METVEEQLGREPVYDWKSWALAGHNPRPGLTYRVKYDEKLGDDESGLALRVPVVTVLPDAARRRDIVQHIRDVSGDDTYVDAVTGLRLARAIAADRSHPAVVDSRAAVADIPSDGDAPGFNGAAPDPWGARDHEMVVKRNAKGATVKERRRVGKAYVIGGTHAVPPTDPDAAASDDAVRARTAAAVLLRGVKRTSVGADTLDVLRIADICYRGLIDHPVIQMIGTDVTSWEQVVHADQTDRSDVTVGRSYLSGQYGDTDWDWFAAPTAVYRANTRRTVRTVRHKSRTRLPIGRPREADRGPICRGGILHTVSPRYTAPVLVTPLVWSLVSAGHDQEHRWLGHVLHVRPKSTTQTRKAATERNAARTIGTVHEDDAPTTAAGWEEVCNGLNRGERVKVGRVTITRQRAQFAATDRRDGSSHRWQRRTAASMAAALAGIATD